MALASEMNKMEQGPLSDESMGKAHGEVIRDYTAKPGAQWRFGKPNYARVNKLYFQYRSKIHPEGSLESIVNKLVKNWEVESHHLSNPHDWQTMDVTKFTAQLNGGQAFNAQYMADVGPYNLLIGETPTYSSKALTFEESNKIFGSTFADGFAWECTEVLSGPPVVAFKWRHFGKFSGTFTDKNGQMYKGNGGMLNLLGMCIAKVSDKLVIEALDVYYNPDDMLKVLTTKPFGNDDSCVMAGDEGESKQVFGGCCSAKR